MPKRIYTKILTAIAKADRIILTTHIRPDGDALGAVLALYYFIQQKNIPVEIVVNDRIPSSFNFLPLINKIKSKLNQKINPHTGLLIFVDCADLSRAGTEQFLPSNLNNLKIINIDHHATNSNFGNLNLVQNKSSSTCEILYDFFKNFKVKINKQLATFLLTGIVTDTDNFSLPNTSFKTMQAVSDLTRSGAALKKIIDNIYRQVHLAKLKLWGTVLSRLVIDSQTGFAVTTVFLKDLEKNEFKEDFITGLSNFLNNLKDVKGILVLKEEDQNKIRGSLRTTRSDVDVAKIAAKYGGGGHKKAAGFNTAGKIIQDKNGVWGIEEL